ncbi:MAG: PfkB family carbohydrate kinase [Bacteroidota bacterium]
MSILAIGTVAFDSIETPFGSADYILGGSATYITLAARYFTNNLGLVGVVGGDFPDAHLDLFRERGIGLEGLEIDANGKTFFWAGKYHYDLNERDTLTTDLNVLATFQPKVPDARQDARIVCLGNLEPGIQRSVVAQAADPDFVICDTMNFWIENTPDSLVETLKVIDCLIINDAEARELADEPNLFKAARAIQAMGPRILVIKKGEHGALLFAEDEIFAVPAYPLEDIFDPTGAGDTFMGGFAGYLARVQRYDVAALRCAVVVGSAMASFCVEKFGPERLYDLSTDAINDRIQAFHALTVIPSVEAL